MSRCISCGHFVCLSPNNFKKKLFCGLECLHEWEKNQLIEKGEMVRYMVKRYYRK